MLRLILILAALSPSFAGAPLCEKPFAQLISGITPLKGEALVNATYRRLAELAAKPPEGVEVKLIGHSDGYPIHLVRVKSPDPKAPRVFVSAGVHGDEPLGVTTSLLLLDETIRHRRYDLTYVPMMNPGGLRRETRHNLAGHDINRSFLGAGSGEAAQALRNGVAGNRFAVAVDLHGANRKTQFFLITAREKGARVEEILGDVPRELLLPSTSGKYPDFAPGLNNPTQYRMLFPGAAVSHNEGTVKDFLLRRSPRSYTLEYPGALDPALLQEWNYRILTSILETARQEKP